MNHYCKLSSDDCGREASLLFADPLNQGVEALHPESEVLEVLFGTIIV
jgi:hypothetical protein